MAQENSTTVSYEVQHGWNPALAVQADCQWAEFYVKLFEHIQSLNLSEQEETEILDSIQTGDKHWNWFNKTHHYRKDEYEWFFLLANGATQGICLFYHPKPSLLEKGDIFYVEYIAVAPWNRNNKIHKKIFKGIGSVLLKCTINYAKDTLGLKPGFSLHSLKQAEDYYSKIGMTQITGEEKEGMTFFEMTTKNAIGMEDL